MSIVVDTRSGTEILDKFREELGSKRLARGVAKCINQTLVEARVAAIAAIKNTYNIPSSYLGRIRNQRANRDNMEGSISADPTPLPLRLFSPKFDRQKSNSGKAKHTDRKAKRSGGNRKINRKASSDGKGVTVEIHRGSRQTIKYAFMLPKSTKNVFARGAYRTGSSYGFVRAVKRVEKTGSDTPITSLITMSVRAAIFHKSNATKITQKINALYPQLLLVDMERRVDKLKAQQSLNK